MSVDIVEDDSPAALLQAARIWAAATAVRDGLREPAPADQKAPGIRAALAVPGSSLHIARREHLPVGFAVLVPSDSRLEVRYLGVAPAAWGQGVATALLDHVSRAMRTARFDAAELWVLDGNERAIAVYLHAGWALTTDVKSHVETRRIERRLELRVGRSA